MSIAPISHFFILSPRGDTIISKDYRGDVVPGGTDIFFRKVKFTEGGDPPPCMNIDGVNYLFVRKNGLLFGVTTRWNCSPSQVIELLHRLAKVFKDYCGTLTEEAIRKNFILIYELLDEMLDYGYPQTTGTESLKSYVYNEPIAVEPSKSLRIPSTLGAKTNPSSAAHKPITGSTGGAKQRNEIFVDILERLNVLFGANGQILNSSIDGCIQMKSYLSGNPELKLALNEDLVIGRGQTSTYGAVVLDDCNFHECVRLDDFESGRQLTLVPPDGEFVALNYRITAEFRAPFRMFPSVTETDALHLELLLLVRADMPEAQYGSNVVVSVPVPRAAGTVSAEIDPRALPGQSAEYNATAKRVDWTIKRFQGGTEQSLRVRVTLTQPCTATTRRELGPISASFEVPMYSVSGLQVRYLKIADAGKAYNPYRWVRYVTLSSSYVARVG
ncbi:coatomer protein complex, gamma sub-unit [Tribonema minus]|uniref:Coatomer protein complex, gamma sub-unit n=1 Tax=Tribonema minus TaxID=303371 RepID=A0A835YW81_9STRA|nr:coatomer protein complex, gamma sub-unit [Tribonema minus]